MTATDVRRELLLVAVPATAAAVLVQILLGVASYRAPFALCLLVGLAGAASWRLAAAVRPPDVEELPAEDPDRATVSHRNGFEMLVSLEHRLSWGSFDPDRFEQRLRPQLTRIATERLHRRHGVDPDRQPEQARRIVGERLWELMTAPGQLAKAPDRNRMRQLLADLEAI